MREGDKGISPLSNKKEEGILFTCQSMLLRLEVSLRDDISPQVGYGEGPLYQTREGPPGCFGQRGGGSCIFGYT